MKKTNSTQIGSFISYRLASKQARQTTGGKHIQFAKDEIWDGSRVFAWNG